MFMSIFVFFVCSSLSQDCSLFCSRYVSAECILSHVIWIYRINWIYLLFFFFKTGSVDLSITDDLWEERNELFYFVYHLVGYIFYGGEKEQLKKEYERKVSTIYTIRPTTSAMDKILKYFYTIVRDRTCCCNICLLCSVPARAHFALCMYSA